MDARVGTELAGYRIEGTLGRGGMSVVYLGEHLGLRRKVALKVLAPELDKDERFRERFIRESQLAASLEHPNIVPIYEAGEADGLLFIAMRYVAGTDLRALIEAEGSLDPERTIAIVTQVAGALDAAHARGLVHRDVKPANILIAGGAPFTVYLSDFGLTKSALSDTGITKTGQFMGTIDYAAPEQFEGKPLDGRTDVYSLGCVLYQCLTGEVPFRRDQEAAVMYAHLTEPPPHVTDRRPDLPVVIDHVVAEAMAKRPEDRYATCGELAAAVGDALGGGETERAAGPPPRRGRKGALAAVAAIVVAAIGAVVLLTRGGGPSPKPSGSPRAAMLPAGSVVQVDPEAADAIVAVVPGLFGEDVAPNLAAGEGGIWVVSIGGTHAHIDPRTKGWTSIDVLYPADVATGYGAAWVVGGSGVSRVSPSTDEVRTRPIRTLALGLVGTGVNIAVGERAVWVELSGTVLRIDPITLRPEDRLSVGTNSNGIAVGQGAVWAIDSLNNTVTRVDPRTDRIVAKIPLQFGPDDIAAGPEGVWVVGEGSGIVTKIDPETNTAGPPIRVGNDPMDIAVGLGAVWVPSYDDRTISKIDPVTGFVVGTIDVGPHIATIAVDRDNGYIWVSVWR